MNAVVLGRVKTKQKQGSRQVFDGIGLFTYVQLIPFFILDENP
jgi:hypothetical protein